MDVFKLQELRDDPDPHATLPFISHHTLNISRELDDGNDGTVTNIMVTLIFILAAVC